MTYLHRWGHFEEGKKYPSLRPNFTSNLVQGLAFGTPKFYIAPYSKIKHRFVNLSFNCDVKSGLIAE